MNLPGKGPTRVEELKAEIRRQVEFLSRAKSAQEALTKLSRYHADGLHWWRFKSEWGWIWPDPKIKRGVVLNYIGWVVDQVVATAMDAFIPEAYSAADSMEAQRKGFVATALLRDIHYRNGGFARQARVARKTMVAGDHFVRVEIDENQLDTLYLSPEELEGMVRISGVEPVEVEPDGRDKLRVLMRLGHVVERDVNANWVLIPNGVARFEDARWFIVAEYLPVESVERLANNLRDSQTEDLGRLKAESVRDIDSIENAPLQTESAFGGVSWETLEDRNYGSRYSEESGLVMVVGMWVQDLDSGRWSCYYCAGGNQEVYLGERRGMAMHNYVQLGFRETAKENNPWHQSISSRLTMVNANINALATEMMLHFIRSLKETIIVPQGSKIEAVDGRPWVVVETNSVTGDGVRVLSVPSQTLAEMRAELLDKRQQLRVLAGLSEMATGAIPNRIAGQTYQMAMASDRSQLSDFFKRFRNSYERIYQIELWLAKESGRFDLPRISGMLGDRSEFLAQEFRGKDLGLGMNLRTRPAPPDPESPTEREGKAAELATMGLFQPGPEGEKMRELYNEYRTEGRFETTRPFAERMNRLRAMEEGELIKRGLVEVTTMMNPEGEEGEPNGMLQTRIVDRRTSVPLLDDMQPHVLDIEVHLSDLSALRAGSVAYQILKAHIEEHQEVIRAGEEAAKAEELEFVGRKSIEQAQGPGMVTVMGAEAKNGGAAGTPSSGGIRSGVVRGGEQG